MVCETSERFIVVDNSDARVPEDYRDGWHLIDTVTGEWIGCDGGEPEDQSLVRDWDWVATKLNQYNKEYHAVLSEVMAENEQLNPYALESKINELESENKRLRIRLRDTCQILISEIGAEGPCDAEDAANKAVAEIKRLREYKDF
jgi:hypothetical protein